MPTTCHSPRTLEQEGFRPPYIRLYDDLHVKRPIRVSIAKFYGIGQHFFVTMTAGFNYVVDEEGKRWQCRDDMEGEFRYPGGDLEGFLWLPSGRFNTIEEAEQFIEHELSQLNMDRFTVDYDACEGKWTYKDGD